MTLKELKQKAQEIASSNGDNFCSVFAEIISEDEPSYRVYGESVGYTCGHTKPIEALNEFSERYRKKASHEDIEL